MSSLFLNSARVRVSAYVVGERIDVRSLEIAEPIAMSPLTVHAGDRGVAVIFRYGVVVIFNLGSVEEAAFLKTLQPFIGEPVQKPELETAELRPCELDKDERAQNGVVTIRNFDPERIQLVAEVLAKSSVLAHYEGIMRTVFERFEPLARELERDGRSTRRVEEIMRDVGSAFIIQHRMVGRVEVNEKPDLLWDRPELESLWARLTDEYELRERHVALDRKLDLVSRTAGTLVDLLQQRRSHLLEWGIVFLIIFEIAFTLGEKLIR